MPNIDMDFAVYGGPDGFNELDIDAGETVNIGQNEACGENPATGDARRLVDGDAFVGFAEAERVIGAAGDGRVRLRDKCMPLLTIAGVAKTDRGATVYALGPNSFSLTPTAAPSLPVGTVHRVPETGKAYVKVDV